MNWFIFSFDIEAQNLSPISPMNIARYDYGAVNMNGLIYVAGGEGLNREELNSVECYDPRNDHWTVLSSMNASRKGFALVASHGYIYAFGGSALAHTPLRKIEQYDPRSDRWTLVRFLPIMPNNHYQ